MTKNEMWRGKGGIRAVAQNSLLDVNVEMEDILLDFAEAVWNEAIEAAKREIDNYSELESLVIR